MSENEVSFRGINKAHMCSPPQRFVSRIHVPQASTMLHDQSNSIKANFTPTRKNYLRDQDLSDKSQGRSFHSFDKTDLRVYLIGNTCGISYNEFV